MGKSLDLIESLKDKLSVTRRGFIKSVGAAGAAAALYGCSKDDGGDVIYSGSTGGGTLPETPVSESVFIGTSPHNCGGGACVLAAHVAGGRIIRYTTDERPGTVDMIDYQPYSDSQKRGCVRCRSKKEWIYRTDRLLYPLKQTKERGDLSGFKRISWGQAYKEIATELERIKNTYGPESFHKFYSTGDGAAYPRSREISANILWGLGGEYVYNDDYSYPSWYHASSYTFGIDQPYVGANSAPDLIKSSLIVMWSSNVSEMINNCNCSWYLTQARDMGVPVISVDQRLSKTASMLSTGAGSVPPVITPVGGTDSALIAAILYHLIEKHIEASSGGDIWNDSAYLKPRHITKYVHGFFDKLPASGEGSVYSYLTVGDDASYVVPEGASYSAYIFGSSDALVRAGFNLKPSVYPNQIGYNASGEEFIQADGSMAVDPVFGKYAPCYGQVPKTPEWAEKITGVSAANIRAFAELLASNFSKLSLLHCGGFQRNTEGEQNPRSFFILAAVLGAFGLNGATFGNPSSSAAAKSGTLPSFTVKDTNDLNIMSAGGALKWADADLKAKVASGDPSLKSNEYLTLGSRYDTSKLTYAALSQKAWPYLESQSFPVFMWQDAIERGRSAGQKSRWNVPPIENGPAIKLIFNFGGNCVVNQCGDYGLTTKILSLSNAQADKAGGDLENYPNRKYQLELLVTSDHFMTASCQWSDYVLPAAMAFERSFYKSVGDAVHFSPKAVDAPGEVRSDFQMTVGIANALSTPLQVSTKNIVNEDDLLREMYNAPTTGAHTGMTYDEFKKLGVVTAGSDTTVNVAFSAFRTDPAASKLNTPTGKIEAYSQGMVENYEARGFNNIDSNITLPNGGSITTKGSPASTNGRIVYPIPMYIPLVEGRHACDNDASVPTFDGTANGPIDAGTAYGATKHPDLTGSNTKGYTYRLHTWHMQYRSHSTLNSNAYLDECYKLNSNGEPTFYALDRGQAKVYGTDAAVCDDNVYEPVFISPATASAISLPEKGAVVIIYNDRGAIYAYAKSSPLVQDGEIMIGQGSWASPSKTDTFEINGHVHKVDVGGCANTLISIRPSRICQGMTLANDCKVGIKVK